MTFRLFSRAFGLLLSFVLLLVALYDWIIVNNPQEALVLLTLAILLEVFEVSYQLKDIMALLIEKGKEKADNKQL